MVELEKKIASIVSQDFILRKDSDDDDSSFYILEIIYILEVDIMSEDWYFVLMSNLSKQLNNLKIDGKKIKWYDASYKLVFNHEKQMFSGFSFFLYFYIVEEEKA